MRNILCPIVGAFHRPPARQLLAVLQPGVQLILEPEPENPYDSSAIRVMLDPLMVVEAGGISAEAMQRLTNELPLSGFTIEQVMSGGPIQLGYVAATGGKPLAKLNQERAKLGEPELQGNQQALEIMAEGQGPARLEFAPDGKPLCRLSSNS